jgi:tight adherence protein C
MPFELLLTLGGVFISVALLTGSAASFVLSRTTPERQRLRELTARAASPGVGTVRLTEVPNPAFKRFAKALPKSQKGLAKLRQQLAVAGYDSLNAAVAYSTAQIALPVVLGIVPVFILGVRTGWIVGICTAAFGALIPNAFVTRQTRLRRKTIQSGLPDALDLLVVCLEAGSSLDQAIVKASNELEIALPAIAREMRTIATEIRAGKPRLEAFHNFARRMDIEDVRALVATLVQTDRFGTSIGQALRTHADTSRTKRRQQAEERAAKVGVKLVFPLALFLMPSLFVVCLGPVVVRVYRAFF